MTRFFGRGDKQADEAAGQTELALEAVEGILAAIGVEPRAARMQVESGFGWHFQRGSALIEVYLTPEQEGYLQVLSPIMHLPAQNLLALYRRLLELNLQLTNAALGLHEDVVYVYHERLLAVWTRPRPMPSFGVWRLMPMNWMMRCRKSSAGGCMGGGVPGTWHSPTYCKRRKRILLPFLHPQNSVQGLAIECPHHRRVQFHYDSQQLR